MFTCVTFRSPNTAASFFSLLSHVVLAPAVLVHFSPFLRKRGSIDHVRNFLKMNSGLPLLGLVVIFLKSDCSVLPLSFHKKGTFSPFLGKIDPTLTVPNGIVLWIGLI